MGIPIKEFSDIKYLQRVVIHLYDLLDDIDTADDMAKDRDDAYRKIIQKLQAKKIDSGVSSPDGYGLAIEQIEFKTKEERGVLFG
jgi:hypothetical protein